MPKIIFETDAYVRSHDKQPRGRGSWAFGYADASGTEELTVFSPGSMTLTEAKRWFRAQPLELGSYYVSVLERIPPGGSDEEIGMPHTKGGK